VFADNVGTGEYAEGGGIYVFGVVNLNDCTISGNRGEGYYSRGGGLHVDYFGQAGVARCTFSGNSATGLNSQGGGIYNYGRLEIVNSTLSGNHSGETGGGIHVDALSKNTAIRNCTISGNTARTGGAGLCNYAFPPHSNGPRTVKDSFIAGN
jgi:predicted outer membrane repeat protein